MIVRQPRYSKEEFARRGDEIYESQLRSPLKTDNHRKIVAIALETRAFQVVDEPLAAALLLTRI